MAVKENSSLQSFQLDCVGTSMSDETGTALATALKENSSLQSFQLTCLRTSMSDDDRQRHWRLF